MDAQGNIYLGREDCYAINRLTVQGVSGGIEKGESKLTSAKRELREETGLTARQWTYLGVIDPFTMTVVGPNHMYLAEGLVRGVAELEEVENLKVIRVPFVRAMQWVNDGTITHAATCTALLKIALMRRQKRMWGL